MASMIEVPFVREHRSSQVPQTQTTCPISDSSLPGFYNSLFFFILLSLVCGVSGSVGVRKRLHKGLQQSPFPIISRLDRCVHIRKHFIQNRQYMQRKTRDTDEENKTGENRPER